MGSERRPSAGLSSSIQEFCRTSSAHGLGHLPDGSGHSRCLWLLIVLALLVALFYNVSVSLYREAVIQPVKTENTWIMSDGSLPLPRITLCDLSMFRQSRLDARNVSDEMASYLASSLGGDASTAETFLNDTERQARLQAEYQALLKPGENFPDLVEALSPSCDDVIKACQLADAVVAGAECCRRFITAVYTVRGKCLQVADSVQKGEGKEHGILFTMSLPPAEFPFMDRSLVSGCLNSRVGMEVLLDDHARLPHKRVYTHSVPISAPAAIELRVTRETSDRHGLKDSVFPSRHRCAHSKEPDTSSPLQSADNCPVLELAAQVRSVCGCHWLSMPAAPAPAPAPAAGAEPAAEAATTTTAATVGSAAPAADNELPLPICSPHQVFSCVIPLQKNMSTTECPPACHEQFYHPDVLSATISPALNMMAKGLGIAPDEILFLQIYFKSLQYQLVRQWCQSGSELLAELGGHMGIFLGVSVVTICELLAALGGFLCGRGCRRRGLGGGGGGTGTGAGGGAGGGEGAGAGGAGIGRQGGRLPPGHQIGEALQKDAWTMKGHTMCVTFKQTSPSGEFVPPSAIYHPPAGGTLDPYSHR